MKALEYKMTQVQHQLQVPSSSVVQPSTITTEHDSCKSIGHTSSLSIEKLLMFTQELLHDQAMLIDTTPEDGEDLALSGEDINAIMRSLLLDIDIIHPDLLSISSLFDSELSSGEAAFNLADQIYQCVSKGPFNDIGTPINVTLERPVIMIVNTSSGKRQLTPLVNPNKIWGSH